MGLVAGPEERRQCDGDDGTRQLLTGIAPLLVLGLWQMVQWVRFDEWPLAASGDTNLAAPFTGLV